MTLAPEYHDPTQLGIEVAGCEQPLLIGLDIDGVLAPLVDHADDARLLDGIADVLSRLLAADDVTVAAVSGRAVSSMRTFGLPASVRLVGSHGMEEDGRPLSKKEKERLGMYFKKYTGGSIPVPKPGHERHVPIADKLNEDGQKTKKRARKRKAA